MLCNICPRRCNALRTPERGEGYCHCPSLPIVARAAPHYWEEPCISGERGSGTVFFGGCSLGCVFCQNHLISHTPQGQPLTPAQLALLFERLECLGVHNINLVTPTHFAPWIIEALKLFRPSIPVIWNSSGYETVEMVHALHPYIDIFLPDFKYASSKSGADLANAPDYFSVSLQAIRAMCELSGPPVYDQNGIMRSGTLVRHLILPLRSSESIALLNTIADVLPKGTPVSLMRQFTPIVHSDYPELNRRLTAREYKRVADHMLSLNLPGFIQQKEAAQSAYTPAFMSEDSLALLKGF